MKVLSFSAVLIAVLLAACSPQAPASPSGEQPTPEVAEILPATDPAFAPPPTGFLSVDEVDAAVEVGVGSPIPVFVNIGAHLPDACAQVELVEVLQDETFFGIYVGTVPSTDEACLKGAVPFRMKLPLNVVNLPAGSYNVQVNSVPADFKLDTGAASGGLRTREMPFTRDDLLVDDVRIEVGVGSPRPVTAVVSANLPKTCAQLGEVRMHRDGTNFFVHLIAYVPADIDCNPDTLPVRFELPLNTVNLPDGTYEVTVNGATTTFDMPLQ